MKHLVEEQCFSKPSPTLETCSVDISIQLFLADCTHYQHLCLYVNKPTIRGLHVWSLHWRKKEEWLCYWPFSQKPLLISSQTSRSYLNLTFELVWTGARIALYSYFLLLIFWMENLHKINTLRTLMQICKMTIFDKLWIMISISFSYFWFVTWLCEHVHVCVYVCAWVCVVGDRKSVV